MSLQGNANILYQNYLNLGVPDQSARALASVQAYENGPGALPNPVGDRAGVFGISQWTDPSRQSFVTNWLDNNGFARNDLLGQQQATLAEMQQNYPSVYSSVMDGSATPNQIIVQYETPKGVVNGQIAGGPALKESDTANNLYGNISGGDYQPSFEQPADFYSSNQAVPLSNDTGVNADQGTNTSGSITDMGQAQPAGVESGNYQGQPYTYATPGGEQSATGYGADQTAPASTDQTAQAPASSPDQIAADHAQDFQQDYPAANNVGSLPGPIGQIQQGSAGIGNIGAGGLGQGGFGLGGAAGSSGSSGGDSSTGTPVDITDPHGIASIAGKDVKTGAEDLTKGLGQDTQALDKQVQSTTTQATTETTGLGQYIGNLVYDFVARGLVGVAALILLLMGLWMIGSQKNAKPT